jgi:hypothetical protein
MRAEGFEPTSPFGTTAPKAVASANFATPAAVARDTNDHPIRIRHALRCPSKLTLPVAPEKHAAARTSLPAPFTEMGAP